MKRYLRAVILILVAVSVVACSRQASTDHDDVKGEKVVNFSGSTKDMYSADFWLKRTKNTDKVIMTEEQIQEYNNSIIASAAIGDVNMDAYPAAFDKEVLTKMLRIYGVPGEDRYIGTTKATKSYYNKLLAARNMDAVAEQTVVRYGIVVNETNLRDFPTDDVSYSEPGDVEFDMFQESRLKVWERVAVLHTSLDGKWFYIQSRSYMGWIKAKDVAIADRQTWMSYKDRDFVVVTGNRIVLDYDPHDQNISRKEMMMGTTLPLASGVDTVNGVTTQSSYCVLVPGRDKNGNFVEKTARIPYYWDVNVGYLSFTKENLLNQAFKVLGERYGWGGSFNARDCSMYIRDVYMTFGLQFPRNSASQAVVPSGGHLDVSSMNDTEKEAAIMRQEPGTIIEMKGHVMMYLGSANGKAYIIHDAFAYGESGLGGANGRQVVNCVNISDLYVTKKDGTTFLQNIRNVTPISIPSNSK